LDEYQQMALDRKGERIFYAADEFYIMAGLQFPAAEEYGEYPQLENGVGMARKFIDEAARALQALQSDAKGEKGKTMKKGVLTGEAGARVIGPILDRYYSGKEIEVVVAKNILFGDSISVTGLLGGDDIITALKEHAPCSSELLIPKNLLRESRFIDDLNLDDVRGKTGINLIPVEVNGEALARSLTP
jgi:NifB/MoaA-like Fe-S oxidoreductase